MGRFEGCGLRLGCGGILINQQPAHAQFLAFPSSAKCLNVLAPYPDLAAAAAEYAEWSQAPFRFLQSPGPVADRALQSHRRDRFRPRCPGRLHALRSRTCHPELPAAKNSGTNTSPPSSSGPRPEMPTTPPQVRLPISGPNPAWRNMCGKISPSDADVSLIRQTFGP